MYLSRSGTRIIALSGLCAAAVSPAASCSDPVGPPFSEPIALVRFGGNPDDDRTHRLLAVGLQSRESLGWSESLMYRIIGTALSPDGEALYADGTGIEGWQETQLAELDTRTLRVRTRQFFADSAGYRRDRFNGLAIQTTHEIEVSPDGDKIFLAGARDAEGGWGIAVMDSEDLENVGFVGPYPRRSMSLTVVQQGPFSPLGALAVLSDDSSAWTNAGRTITLVDLETFDAIDLVDLSAELADENDGITQIVAAPSADALYLRSLSGWLLKYDLIGRRIVARVRASAPPCLRCLTVAPDGDRLYLAHTWTRDVPSSGMISVYNDDLVEQPPIDLSGIRVPRGNGSGSDPPALNMVAVAPDGTLLIAAGAMLAQLWGFQSGRILFIDAVSHEVLHTIALRGEVAALEILIP